MWSNRLIIDADILVKQNPIRGGMEYDVFLSYPHKGDLGGTRKIHQQVLETRRRILGVGHPDTSLSACNLVITLLNTRESIEVNQQKIREMMIQIFE